MNPYISAPKNPLYFSLFNLLAFADIAAHSLESGKCYPNKPNTTPEMASTIAPPILEDMDA